MIETVNSRISEAQNVIEKIKEQLQENFSPYLALLLHELEDILLNIEQEPEYQYFHLGELEESLEKIVLTKPEKLIEDSLPLSNRDIYSLFFYLGQNDQHIVDLRIKEDILKIKLYLEDTGYIKLDENNYSLTNQSKALIRRIIKK